MTNLRLLIVAEPRARVSPTIWSVDRIHPSAEGHRLIAPSVAELLGVPVDAQADEPELPTCAAVLRRYAVEAAWLLRHGLTREVVSTDPVGAAKP